ncbi:MAG: hypothetical protein WDW38_009178 [Sanguina aurantia]
MSIVRPHWYKKDLLALNELLFASWINVLLVAVPLGFISEHLGWAPLTTFALNFIALIPLALPLSKPAACISQEKAIYLPGASPHLLQPTQTQPHPHTCSYGCYLFFQLKTHKEEFQGEESGEEPMLSLVMAIGLLTIITIIVAFASECLTGSIEEVSKSTGVSQAFLGMIILPIAGNACEHITAVVVAMKNKMDLSLGVAVGSSIQIALFAIPFAVMVGWAVGSNFSLADFDAFPALVLTLAVTHSNFITADATSHWLLGVQLVALYVLIAVTFFFRGDGTGQPPQVPLGLFRLLK